ncbi:LuxR C-terminal-related transcriptional regulator [Streptomyces sp. NPDC001515]
MPVPVHHLTPTELRIFEVLHSAPAHEDIAASLFITTRTVKFHLANLRQKLGGLTHLQLCLLAALHHRGLPALCDSCASGFTDGSVVARSA